MDKYKFALCCILVIAFLFIAGCGTIMTSKNITIAEKFPKHAYMGSCFNGKTSYTCELIDSGFVIDTERNFYTVGEDRIWAKFEINKTYNVGCTGNGPYSIVMLGYGGKPIDTTT